MNLSRLFNESYSAIQMVIKFMAVRYFAMMSLLNVVASFDMASKLILKLPNL